MNLITRFLLLFEINVPEQDKSKCKGKRKKSFILKDSCPHYLLFFHILNDPYMYYIDASITRLYKKGNRQLCDNYRGISLLAIAGKILARVLLIHLEHGLLPESQCGFRGGRGTVDMIFAACQLQQKCQEQYDDLFITLIDLTKAFDTVCRDGLWQIMEKFGCPRKFTALVRQLHDGMRATVLDNGDTSYSFPVTNGVKQVCVLAPTLFSMVFAAMLHDASQDNDDGIQLKYRTDGGVFNLRRHKAKT